MTVEIFVFCGWWFSNQIDILSETHFSCDTVDRGLCLAILSSLLYPETDRNIRIGRQCYVFYFTDCKRWCFDVSFLTSISVSTVVLTQGKVELFFNLRNILFIGFVKFEIKEWFSAYHGQDQVYAWFSLARLPAEAARKLFLYHFLKETALSFVFWLLDPFNAWTRLFCALSFAQSCKILS